MYFVRDVSFDGTFEQGFTEIYTHSRATSIITETLTFGIFTLLLGFALYHIVERGVKSAVTKSMLLFTIVMYACAAMHWALRLRSFYKLISPSVYTLDEVFSGALDQCVPAALLVVDILLSDGIVLWRAWILWHHNRYVQVVSTILLISTLALSAHNSHTVCKSKTFNLLPSQSQASAIPSDDVFGASAFALSLFTNLWSTSLVGCKAWSHRRAVHANLQRGSTRTRTEKIMALLLESGAVYCVLWIFVVAYTLKKVMATSFPYGGPAEVITAGDNFVKGALIQLVGIYPTVVIVVVCLEKAHCDRQFAYPLPVPVRPEVSTIRRVTMTTRAESDRESSLFDIGNRCDSDSGELSSVQIEEERSKESDIESTGIA
ncbi:hypothetical protein OF83DRAFT_1173832 [Amylostereum chailletii]|nr:hypothetical protein OF83DRAFT_1173832 [Amylostereum chailletii]